MANEVGWLMALDVIVGAALLVLACWGTWLVLRGWRKARHYAKVRRAIQLEWEAVTGGVRVDS